MTRVSKETFANGVDIFRRPKMVKTIVIMRKKPAELVL